MKNILSIGLVMVAGLAWGQVGPRGEGTALVLGIADAGTLPVSKPGALVYDFIAQVPLIGDGGTWAPLGGGGGASAKSYLWATFDAGTQSALSANDHAQFTDIYSSAGSDITLDSTSSYVTTLNTASKGRITLAGGKTYRLTFSQGYTIYNGAGGYTQLVWFNSDDGGVIGQNGMYTGSLDTAASVAPTAQVMQAVYTPVAQCRVEVRIKNQSGLIQWGGGGSSDKTFNLNPTAMIEVWP